MNVLVGDIGGTRSRLALYDGPSRLAERTYSSREHSGLEHVLRRFIEETGARADVGCFAIAGPVRDGACVTTNLPWVVQERSVAESAGLRRALLVNDFAAQAVGVTLLRDAEIAPVLSGAGDPRAPVAVLGAGTGLGEAYVLRASDGRVEALPGEGGHGDFAPTDARQDAVLRELRAEFGRVSYERVLSGPGLSNVYRALLRAGYAPERLDVAAAMRAEEPSAVITREALAGDAGLCGMTVEVFVEAYAQEASNMALRALATGGVFLAGGIAPRVLHALRTPRFESRFRQKSPHEALLREIPVSVVLDTQAGLRGAALLAQQLR